MPPAGAMERAEVLDTRAVGAKAAAPEARRAIAARYFILVVGNDWDIPC